MSPQVTLLRAYYNRKMENKIKIKYSNRFSTGFFFSANYINKMKKKMKKIPISLLEKFT